ncbi:hypothetical protein AO368_1186 [Moraxella catarrhalis]|uniref:hypothetical protein n=1 Tax=Moraxella catarrhalis TaxID=480 RepID=UPI0007E2EBF2|nr:hypothetical protein [Moraxella catarrhalis]OAV28842.1 hypothetical protein AO368_1186 [Moraxella catarrhalis]
MELEFIVNKDVSRPIAYDENSKNGKVLNGKEKIVLIFLAVLLVLVIFGLSLLNFLWVELPKVIRRPDGEGFIHQKIDDEEIYAIWLKKYI